MAILYSFFNINKLKEFIVIFSCEKKFMLIIKSCINDHLELKLWVYLTKQRCGHSISPMTVAWCCGLGTSRRWCNWMSFCWSCTLYSCWTSWGLVHMTWAWCVWEQVPYKLWTRGTGESTLLLMSLPSHIMRYLSMILRGCPSSAHQLNN